MSSDLASDVLRYWMALLRQEEALAVRPRARKGSREPSASPVGSPNDGQDYAKLPFADNEPFLLRAEERLKAPLSLELAQFFEDWLSKQYRSAGEEGRLEHLVSFPTLLLPRDELAGLLRFGVGVEWWAGAKRFAPPKPRQRAQGTLPPPPDSIQIVRGPVATDDALPYFVDSKLLRDVLRIDLERLDELFVAAKDKPSTPRALVLRVCELIAAQMRDDGAGEMTEQGSVPPSLDKEEEPSSQTLLALLHRLTQERLRTLGSRTRVYPVALLLDASRNRTTFHVQRDLQASLSRIELGQAGGEEPLMTYLGGAATEQEAAPPLRESVLGRFRGAGLTDSQRRAGEQFLGNRLTAVQGPPGTGKTHLILTLAAAELIRKFSPLQRIKQPAPEILLVTSTNNRAVDNVVHPLGREFVGSPLPLSLRVGSRDVVEKVTQAELLRAKSWLERAPELSEAELSATVLTFTAAEERVVKRLSALQTQRDRDNQLAVLKTALSRLPKAQQAEAATEELTASLKNLGVALVGTTAAALDELMQALRELSLRLRVLSELSEASQATAPKHLALHYKVTRDRNLARVEKILGSPLELELPPAIPATAPAAKAREMWEEAAEEALGLVTAFRDALDGPAQANKSAAERQRITRQLRELEDSAASPQSDPESEVDWKTSEEEQAELFEAAIKLREAWARANKKALVAALGSAAQTCGRTRSLRALLETTKGPGVWLKRLFPVWGCTLLSMGNNFSPESGIIRRVVIDEAGQCHGAYAVSALLRAESALVIGDVNQLEPVVELSLGDESRVLRGCSPKSEPGRLAPFRVYQGSHVSAQSIADRALLSRPTLVDHFRCQPEIAKVCDDLCGYGLFTRTARRSHSATVSELTHPLLFSDVPGQQQRFSGSWTNSSELSVVQRWLRRLLSAGIPPGQLGVVTPFRGQLESLWRELRQAKIPLERPMISEDLDQGSLFGAVADGVAVGTVHRFQGGERSIILFSTTITQARSLHFVDERVNLVNVAASRAKEHLITIGHVPTLMQGTHTSALIREARPAMPVG